MSPDNFTINQSTPDGLNLMCKSCIRDSRLRQYYCITLADYTKMLADQGGVCAICKCEPDGKDFAVDHDHRCCPGKKTCGKCIRSLLCENCNRAIGQLQDDPALLRRAAEYIEGHRE